MSYIGRNLNIGDRKILSVTGSSPATSYTLQHNSQNFSPSSAQNILVSVNGVIQEPVTAYSVSGATLDFNGVSVASADIDFVIAEGISIDVCTPSSGTVNASTLSSTFYLENPTSYTDLTITSGRNAMLVGTVTINGTLQVPANSTLVVI
jgi:hypothetical protein